MLIPVPVLPPTGLFCFGLSFLFCEVGLIVLPWCPYDQADTESERGPCGLGLVLYLTSGQRHGPHPSHLPSSGRHGTTEGVIC